MKVETQQEKLVKLRIQYMDINRSGIPLSVLKMNMLNKQPPERPNERLYINEIKATEDTDTRETFVKR
jgi:hypothetical protein